MENTTGNARTMTKPFLFSYFYQQIVCIIFLYPTHKGKYIYCMWSPGHAGRSNSITAGTEEGTKIIGG